MSEEMWREVWRSGQKGFQMAQAHPDLVRFGPEEFAGASRVLVPLCGQSPDLIWLAERFPEVVGVEFVAEAAEGFARKHGMAADERGDYRLGGLTLVVGDFLALTPSRVGTFDAVWDRAAIVALDEEQRAPYVGVITELLRPRGRVLMETFAFDESMRPGPPHSVPEGLVRGLYSGYEIEVRQSLVQERPGVGEWTTTIFAMVGPA